LSFPPECPPQTRPWRGLELPRRVQSLAQTHRDGRLLATLQAWYCSKVARLLLRCAGGGRAGGRTFFLVLLCTAHKLHTLHLRPHYVGSKHGRCTHPTASAVLTTVAAPDLEVPAHCVPATTVCEGRPAASLNFEAPHRDFVVPLSAIWSQRKRRLSSERIHTRVPRFCCLHVCIATNSSPGGRREKPKRGARTRYVGAHQDLPRGGSVDRAASSHPPDQGVYGLVKKHPQGVAMVICARSQADGQEGCRHDRASEADLSHPVFLGLAGSYAKMTKATPFLRGRRGHPDRLRLQ
jgi:hypothetical protein